MITAATQFRHKQVIIVKKGQCKAGILEEQILYSYVRVISTRYIVSTVEELYGVYGIPDISTSNRKCYGKYTKLAKLSIRPSISKNIFRLYTYIVAR